MLVDVGNKVSARAGDLVRVVAKLPKNCDEARLSIWSATKGYELSPHIQLVAIGVVTNGKPQMVPPLRFVLRDTTGRSRVIEFIADEDLIFRVRQDKDEDYPSAKVRIKRYGKVAQKVRSCLRDAYRFVRGLPYR